MSSNIKW